MGHYRLPGAGRDGVLRRRGRALVRAIHHGDECAVVAAWATGGSVRLRASGPSRDAAGYALERMRFALNLDHDLAPFHDRFKSDRLLGPILRRRPWLRPSRIADPFQALAWAITEQLIEVERALAIQRRLTWRFGRRSACGTLVDSPSAGQDRGLRARRAPGLRPQRGPLARAGPLRARGGHRPRRPAAPPTTRAAGSGSTGSARSARGRSRSSRSTGRAATTSCPRATSPTSSSSAAWRGSAGARPSTR